MIPLSLSGSLHIRELVPANQMSGLMFRSLARNVWISALAFFAVSLLGLLIVPLLINQYGLEGFGLISLARLLLPLAALAVLDIGFGEIAIHFSATARHRQDWVAWSRISTLNGVAAIFVGGVAGAILLFLAPLMVNWARVPDANVAEMTSIIKVTALTLPFLFFCLVVEGILKGFERFTAQRSLEVFSALIYAAIAVVVVSNHLHFKYVCYGLLVAYFFRTVLASSLVYREFLSRQVRPVLWTRGDWDEFRSRARGFSRGKVLGVIQAHSPSIAITMFLGPAALGAFEALSRLPRFAKSVLGLLNSIVQPVAARLDDMTDHSALSRLGRIGILIVGASTAPILGVAFAFSEPALRLWLAPGVSQYWQWQAAYFLIPTLGALVGFGGSALLGRRDVVSSFNRLTQLNVLFAIVGGVILLPWFQERSFIASQVAASLITFPMTFRLISSEMNFKIAHFSKLIWIYIGVIFLSAIASHWAQRMESIYFLVLAIAVWAAVCWLGSIWFALSTGQRKKFFQELRCLVPL
jgi:O-antigen/teichoic acid export membrane protein